MSFFLIAHFYPFRTNNLFFVISGSSKFFCQIVEFSNKNQMGHFGGNILVNVSWVMEILTLKKKNYKFFDEFFDEFFDL